ncbi:MAG: helix-turn-helix domain-containing protein [Candidatus Coproplasma sp.]
MNDNTFGENIKKLRYFYGETQKQLAEAIGVAHNYISMLEKGKRDLPSSDIVCAIANHFRITVEELYRPIANEGYSIKNLTMSWDEIWNIICIMFPVYNADRALMDELFNSAIEMHKKQLLNYKNRQTLNIEVMIEIIDTYRNSWEENKTIESLANILSLLCVICGSFVTKDGEKIEEHAKIYGVLGGKKLSEACLRKDYSIVELETAKKELVNQYEAILDECFETLKRDSEWADVADYFLALSYMVGMVNNEYGLDTNSNIGFEMMQRFALMGNDVAMKFISHSISVFK